MKQSLFKFLLLFFLLLQGCQLLPINSSYQDELSINAPVEHEQIYRLLRQGNRYDEMNAKQRRAVCNRLKLDYKQKADWQTAWLLVYSLNEKFNCVDLNQTLVLLKAIQKEKNTSNPLQWLNNNQLEILSKYQALKANAAKFQRKSRNLQYQLNETETQLQQVISKIQALKTIETNINKKLDDE